MFKAFKTALVRFTDRLRSVRQTEKQSFEQSNNAEADFEDVAETSKSRLYDCNACGTVYLAIDMQVCSQCNGSVEQVSSTFPTK